MTKPSESSSPSSKGSGVGRWDDQKERDLAIAIILSDPGRFKSIPWDKVKKIMESVGHNYSESAMQYVHPSVRPSSVQVHPVSVTPVLSARRASCPVTKLLMD
jgi:hypothetical protein